MFRVFSILIMRRCVSVSLWSDEQALCVPPATLDISGHVRVIVNSLRSPISSENLLTISSGIGKVIPKLNTPILKCKPDFQTPGPRQLL